MNWQWAHILCVGWFACPLCEQCFGVLGEGELIVHLLHSEPELIQVDLNGRWCRCRVVGEDAGHREGRMVPV